MRVIPAFLKPNTLRIILALLLILLSLCYARKESNFPFDMEWIWQDQPVYHTSTDVTHVGLPWPYFSKSEFQAPGAYEPGIEFLGCDKKACVYNLPGQRRLFLYYYNIFLNLVFWYFMSWLLIFIYARFRKRAHSSAG